MKSFLAICFLSLLISCKGKVSENKNDTKNESLADKTKLNDNSGKEISNSPSLKDFVYNPALGEFKASMVLLQVSDIENLLKSELEIMRNEIFARHGYIFEKKELKDYFQNQSWYIAHTNDVKPDLTPLEKKNIALILRYEDYADQHGDDFGR